MRAGDAVHVEPQQRDVRVVVQPPYVQQLVGVEILPPPAVMPVGHTVHRVGVFLRVGPLQTAPHEPVAVAVQRIDLIKVRPFRVLRRQERRSGQPRVIAGDRVARAPRHFAMVIGVEHLAGQGVAVAQQAVVPYVTVPGLAILDIACARIHHLAYRQRGEALQPTDAAIAVPDAQPVLPKTIHMDPHQHAPRARDRGILLIPFHADRRIVGVLGGHGHVAVSAPQQHERILITRHGQPRQHPHIDLPGVHQPPARILIAGCPLEIEHVAAALARRQHQRRHRQPPATARNPFRPFGGRQPLAMDGVYPLMASVQTLVVEQLP